MACLYSRQSHLLLHLILVIKERVIPKKMNAMNNIFRVLILVIKERVIPGFYEINAMRYTS